MYILGYDIGSSSVKAALVDVETGKCIAQDFYPKSEAPIKSVAQGMAEQSPDDWWAYIKSVTTSVLSSARINSSEIKAIGISYQMHGLVTLGSDMKPLRDAIIWCDSRGVPYGNKATLDLGDEYCMPKLLNKPGNFTATKLAWVKEHEPELFEKICKICLPGDYIAYKLTGNLCTTMSGLSEMMLWDFSANAPAQFLMDYFKFPASILPPVVPTFGDAGHVTAAIAAELGLAEGTPVTYRAGDQPNNALSLGVLNAGEIAATAGTSGVVYGIIDKTSYDPQSRVNNFAHVNHSAEDPHIGILLCINGTGILNSWMKRNICPSDLSYPAMNELAAQAPVGSLGVSVLPFGNGAERVLCNESTGCSVHGINFNTHNRSHLLRAAQEGIVFSFIYGIEIMQSMGMKVETIHAGNANMFLSPIFRDTLASTSGATIKLYDTDGAVGSAKGAGIGAGLYQSAADAFKTLKLIDTIQPAEDRTPYIEAYNRWKKLLDNSIAK